ncbi:MAG: ABC transporter permease [Ilumatobacter sp.]|uniref:ABC transporter permease n=1 Tax=Ilumatobacter sp. TaxID=1967498 RepID=UPI00391BF814
MSIIDDPPSDPVERPKHPGLTAERRRARLEAGLVMAGSSVSAVIIALILSAALLVLTGKSPLDVLSTMWDTATTTRFQYETIERAIPFVISAIAFAVAAKMNLFNIGVEGQYLFGMFWAAVAGAYVDLPGPIHVLFILVVGAAAGAFWAGIAGYLKVQLGVSEIISTIMLNAIALQIIDWLFNDFFRFDDGTGSLDVRTKPIPDSGLMPDIVDGRVNGFLVVSLIVAAAYYVLVSKSRFGFRLRASGLNPTAASTSGISSKKMVLVAMLISGGVAGLAGLQYLIGDAGAYGPSRPSGYGFSGLSVALLGRNHPVGIVLAGVLWGFLEASAGPLQLVGIPRSIVNVIQGITLFSVVIVNGIVNRWYTKRTTERAAARLSMEAGE